MIWIAPSEKDVSNGTLERKLWDTADQFRANSGLKAQEYSGPILGIIFLRFAEVRFAAKRAQLESPSPLGGERAGVRGDVPTPRVSRRGSRVDDPAAYHAGRETKGEVVLVSRLRATLQKFNPTLPPEAITAAVDELTRDRSAMSLLSGQVELL